MFLSLYQFPSGPFFQVLNCTNLEFLQNIRFHFYFKMLILYYLIAKDNPLSIDELIPILEENIRDPSSLSDACQLIMIHVLRLCSELKRWIFLFEIINSLYCLTLILCEQFYPTNFYLKLYQTFKTFLLHTMLSRLVGWIFYARLGNEKN